MSGERLRLVGRREAPCATLIDAPATPLDGQVWLSSSPERMRDAGAAHLEAFADGNRGAIVVGHEVSFGGRSWLVAVKGVGARAPLYGDSPADFSHAHELDVRAGGRSLLGAITRESWMGEAPYGGQGLANAEHALALSAPALREALAPAVLCPVIAIVPIPEDEIVDASYYRRHAGAVVQEHRLVPSTVRLFHQSSVALGRDAEAALETLGVRDVAALDAFLDRYLASALALITIGARSARIAGLGFELLDYDDAWLDKDTFVAPDGTLAFADLEALIHVEVRDDAALAQRVRRQLERNAYEVLYGADALLRVEERWRDRPRDQASRRRVLAERCALALVGDPVAAIEARADGWDLSLRPRVGEPVVARWIDAH